VLSGHRRIGLNANRRKRFVLGFLLFILPFLTGQTARAELELTWHAPSGCPKREDVRNRIRTLAGSILDRAEKLSAEGRITRVAGRFKLELSVREGAEVRMRVITATSCAPLAGAAAVTLAILLGVDVGTGGTMVTEKSSAQNRKSSANVKREGSSGKRNEGSFIGDNRRAEVEGTRRLGEKPSEEVLAEEDMSLSEKDRKATTDEFEKDAVEEIPNAKVQSDDPGLSAESKEKVAPSTTTRLWVPILRAPILTADFGPLPRSTLGIGLGGGVRFQSWKLLLSAYRSAVRNITMPGEDSGFGVEVKRTSGHIDLCYGRRFSQFEFAPCIGLALEAMKTRGFGNRVLPNPQWTVWLAPNASATIHWSLMKSLALFVGIRLQLELSQPRLVIDGKGEVTQLWPAAVGSFTGLEWSY
jgi:hypothetical protein